MPLTANAARIIVSQMLLNCGTRAISNWMQRQGQKVSLWQLQQALNMPLVEVWLGLLHSPTPQQWESTGEFYRDTRDFWIGN